jgi:hypothetical protein
MEIFKMNYDAIDARFFWNGDYSLKDGDLADTSEDYLLSLLQEVHSVVASSLRDWENYPQYGATLDDFLGEPNIPSTASAISDRLKISLISAGIVEEQDLAIKVVPVHMNRVLIVIGIDAVSTTFNSLAQGEKLVTSLVFDTVEQQVVFLNKVPQLIPTNR